MPTQQTNLASEAGRDAAMLDVGVSTALVRDAADGASTRSVLSSLKQHWRAFWEWRRRQSLWATVHDLNERELMDIGLTRGEIDCIARHRAIGALRDSTYLWIRSGV